MSAGLSPSRVMMARNSLEELSAKCLPQGVMVALILTGQEPERADWELAARVAVRMAVVIRRDVAGAIATMLASEGADDFLRCLAMDAGKDILDGKAG